MAIENKNTETNLTDKDHQILSITDQEYQPHTWENLKQIITDNDLHLLTRYPSHLQKYRQWAAGIKEAGGPDGVTNFVLEHRLHWEPSPPELCSPDSIFSTVNARPLTNPSDYKILINDWPYGLDKGIYHIIVWLRHRLPSSSEKGDITPETRQMIETFVDSRFCTKLGKDNVLWFRNWPGIQSVRSLEHFHVLIRSAADDLNLEDIIK